MRRRAALAVGVAGIAVLAWRRSRFSGARLRREMWNGAFWRQHPMPARMTAAWPHAGEVIAMAVRNGYAVTDVTRDGGDLHFTVDRKAAP